MAGVSLLLASPPGAAQAGPLGMASDDRNNRLSVFDARLDVITASLDAGPGMALGDCVVSRDERLGVMSGSSAEITFVELDRHASPAAHSGTRLPISNLGVDMALSPDEAFLVLAGGGALQQPLSVVATASRAEVSTSSLFVDNTSVEFCGNGTLLVTTINGPAFDHQVDNALYDARLDARGRISLGGHRLSSGAQPNNSTCAPGSLSGVLLDRAGGVTSFTLPGLEPVQYVDTGPSAALAAAFSSDGKRLYVRTAKAVQAYHFNPLTGAMRYAWAQDAPDTPTYFGMEQIALHPDGDKLYVDGGGSMWVLDAQTGRHAGAIGHGGGTTGICFASTAQPAQEQLAQQEPQHLAP